MKAVGSIQPRVSRAKERRSEFAQFEMQIRKITAGQQLCQNFLVHFVPFVVELLLE
jgi:hypothetical protein